MIRPHLGPTDAFETSVLKASMLASLASLTVPWRPGADPLQVLQAQLQVGRLLPGTQNRASGSSARAGAGGDAHLAVSVLLKASSDAAVL